MTDEPNDLSETHRLIQRALLEAQKRLTFRKVDAALNFITACLGAVATNEDIDELKRDDVIVALQEQQSRFLWALRDYDKADSLVDLQAAIKVMLSAAARSRRVCCECDAEMDETLKRLDAAAGINPDDFE